MRAYGRRPRSLGAPIIGLAVLVLLAASAPMATASFGIFHAQVVFKEAEGTPVLAGAHPFAMTTTVEFNTKSVPGGELLPDEEARDVKVELPPGFIGNPDAVPTCSNAEFAEITQSHTLSNCPISSVVGVADVGAAFGSIGSIAEVFEKNRDTGTSPTPVFLLDPPQGVASKLGFVVLRVPVTIETRINPESPYNLIATVSSVSNVVQVYGSKLTLWGVPADERHDGDRGGCALTDNICPVSTDEIPFLTLPANCHPLLTRFEADSWQKPGAWIDPLIIEADDGGEPPLPVQPGDCEGLAFDPTFRAKPTSTSASSASGLDVELEMPNEGLLAPEGRSEATIEKAVVTLPEGVSANPSAAAGLAGCSPSDLQRETLDSNPGDGCPEAAKIGSVQVETPVLQGRVVKGDVFVATPYDNPFDSLLAAYVVVREPRLGVLLRIAGKIEADPQTGRLVTIFGGSSAELPPLPFSHFRFHLRGGPRSPLTLPARCGTYETVAELTPSSGKDAIFTSSPFQVDSGPGGSPCPNGSTRFDPGLEAGSTDNKGGTYSPFYLRISRADGEPDITRLGAILPNGVVANIAGVPRCPESAILVAKLKSGAEELRSPSCPSGSEIGHFIAGAGTGDALTYVDGRLYLGGPMGGHPLSVIAVTPAVTGPFDLGTVVTRQALALDRSTGQAVIDPAASDPIPQILQGIPLRLRELRVFVDRPNFTTTPTGCAAKAVTATLFGGILGSPQGFGPVLPSRHYQAFGCSALNFKPRLRLRLKGATKRTGHPSLRSTLTFPYPSGPGHSNIKKAVVVLPRSEFIDQGHISNPCIRPQFEVDNCPPGARLGFARAFSPYLDEPLEGPVWFRSNGGARELPDVVADLRGQFRFELVGFVDSKNSRIRTTFANLPDVPVTKFTLTLNGGKRGLLVNSVNLCNKPRRLNLSLTAQNGKRQDTSPLLRTSCKKHK